MPNYRYLCEDCGTEMNEVETISKRKPKVPCTKCGKMSPRSFAGSTGGLKDNPRESLSMGVGVSQIEAAMKKWPGSCYNPRTGALKIQNRTEKKERMKQRGYIEY